MARASEVASPTSVISSSGNSRVSARRMSRRSSGLSSTIRIRKRSSTLASLALELGELIQYQPVEIHVLDHLEQSLEADRLGEVRVDAEIVGAVDVDRLPRGGQHHPRQALDRGLLAHPGEHLEPRSPWQLQVEQHEDRKGEAGAVVPRRRSAQVGDRLLAVSDELHRVGQVRLAERALDQKRVIRRVLHEQDRVGTRVHAAPASAERSSTQKRLPTPGSDSTPARPPRRAAPFWTIARPMPVPGYCCPPCRRSKARKIRSRCSGAIPIPLSSTQSRTRSSTRSHRTRTRGGVSGRVNFAALVMRLATIWPSTARWAITRPSGRSITISPPRSLISRSSGPHASSTIISRLTGSKVISARARRL